MKFLLDVHIPPTLGKLLETKGHAFRLVTQIADPSIADEYILEIAKENGEVILTHDLDFGQLLAFKGYSRPSVIIFRIQHINAQVFFEHIVKYWNDIQPALESGAIILVEPASVRIRNLPV